MRYSKAFPHEVQIKPSGNGGVVMSIGCTIFTFDTLAAAGSYLIEYSNDPRGEERKYYEAVDGLSTEIGSLRGGTR